MRRKICGGTALAAIVGALALAGPAGAGQPIAGCPGDFQLVKAKVDPAIDKNGDGWICTKSIGGPPEVQLFALFQRLVAGDANQVAFPA